MNLKKALILLVSLLIVLIILITTGLLLTSKDNKINPNPSGVINNQIKEPEDNNNNLIKPEPITADSPQAIENTTGQISKVDIGAINITTASGQQIILQVPQKNVSFFKQSQAEDGSFNNKSIGLFELPLNKTVAIQYNGVTNELRMVVVGE